MVMFLKLLLGFAPWLSFLIIAKGSMFRLDLGIIVALALSVVMGVTRLHRGVILWVGLAFFTYALVAVVLLRDMWAVRYMGVLANSALAAGTWLTVAMKKPFTLDYAKDHTDPAMWNHPVFVKTNYLLTAVWGAVFTLNAGLALYSVVYPDFPVAVREIGSYSVMLAALIFTTWYPEHIKRQRVAAEASRA